MNAWSRDLRSHSSLAASPSGSSFGRDSPRRATSPRGGPALVGASPYTRLLAITKDHENVCSHLVQSARQFEEQLRSLRAEHEALRAEAQAMRRCLDRAGVLPAGEVEKEIQSCTSSPTHTGARSSSHDASLSNGPALSTSALDEAASRSASSWPTLSLDSSDLAGNAGPAPSASQSDASGSPGHSRGFSQDGTPPRESQDLYELCQPLFDRAVSAAEQQNNLRLISQLLKNTSEPPNSWRGPGMPLFAAVKSNRVDLARLLLRAKANANERDAKGVSALHLATFDGNADLCRALLVARADVDSSDRHGQTALFFAPSKEVCKLLVEKRADVSVLNRKGQSALHLAGRAGLQEVLAWLSSRVTRPLLELKDVHGATARNYAMQTGTPMTAKEDGNRGVDHGPLPSVSEIAEDELSVASSSRRGEDYESPVSHEEGMLKSRSAPSLTGSRRNNATPAAGYPVKSFGSHLSKGAAGRPAAAKPSTPAVPSPSSRTAKALQAAAPAKAAAEASRASPARQGYESPTRSRPPAPAQSSSGPSGSYAAQRSAARSKTPTAAGVSAAARPDPAGIAKQPTLPTAAAAPVSKAHSADAASAAAREPTDTEASPAQQFVLHSPSDPELETVPRGSGSLEIMYDELNKGVPTPASGAAQVSTTAVAATAATAVAATAATAVAATVATRSMSEAKDSPSESASLEEAGVIDDLAAAGVMEDVGTAAKADADNLQDLGVLEGLEDDGIFEEIGLPTEAPVADQRVSDDLKAAGVVDDLEDPPAQQAVVDDLAAAGVVDDLADAGIIFDADELPAIGAEDTPAATTSNTVAETDDLAELGILGDEDLDAIGVGLGELGGDLRDVGVMDDLDDDGIFDDDADAAALAEAGVLDTDADADALAAAGVFDGEDDAALAEAGVFLGELNVPQRGHMPVVPEEEEGEEEEEEDYDDEGEEEEEGHDYDDDDDEEAW